MTSVLTHLHATNSLLCLLLAGHFACAGTRRKLSTRILALNYLLYACQSLLLIARLNDLIGTAAVLRPVIAMMLGPAFYLYFRSIKTPQPVLREMDFLHLLPAFVVAALFISQSPLLNYVDYLILGSYLSYMTMIVSHTRKGVVLFNHLNDYAPLAFRLVNILTALMLINFVSEVAIFLEINDGTVLAQAYSLLIASILFLLFNGVTIFIALRRNPLIEWMYEVGNQLIYEKNPQTLNPGYVREIFTAWEALVEKEQLFKLEFGITLSQAAQKLQVPARHLSIVINQVFGKSFSKYLNHRRVKEAQKILTQTPDASIIDVMYAAGFSSKSNFNKEFLRIVGKTPSAFKDNMEDR